MQVLFAFVMMLSSVRAFTSRALQSSRGISLVSTMSYKSSDKVTTATFKASTTLGYTGDLLLIPFYKSAEKDDKANIAFLKNSIPSGLPDDIKSVLSDLFEEGNFKADVASKQVIRLASSFAVKYVAVIGLGADPKKNDGKDLEIASALRIGNICI
jgi:hypothetical protein